MTLLENYRSRPSLITPAAFSAFITGASVLYLYDPDPRAKRSWTERRFSPAQAAMLARQHYSPFWSLNMFKNGERKERCFASTLAVGVDIDCATTPEFKTITAQDLDSRKNTVLLKLQALAIESHMVNETPKGLHIVFFIERRAGPEGLRFYQNIMPLLVSYFGADEAAALVTQLLRFPNALHQKNPQKPSLCICLINQLTLPPYNPEGLLTLLQERCPPPAARQRVSRPRIISPIHRDMQPVSVPIVLLSRTRIRAPAKKWQAAMSGVGEGRRNDAAASVAGMLLHTFSPAEWQSRAWPVFRGWNERNKPPLDETELREVFQSIQKIVGSKNKTVPTSQRVRVRFSLEMMSETMISTPSPKQP